MLFEIGAFDPTAFISALILLTAATLFATWLPARRATRINPMVALRTE
jgi:ABC-type antimicrobial peptide transport system permease subunit